MRKHADTLPAALLASLFTQSGIIAYFAGRGPFAGFLVTAGLAVLLWRLRITGILTRERAFRLAILALVPTLGIELFILYQRFHRGGSADDAAYTRKAGVDPGKYRGVILLTEVIPHALVAPPPPDSDSGFGKKKDPLSIPFDGVYWFFKFPDHRPPSNSYSLNGSPAVKTFRSADRIPLEMEARQNFATHFDVSCCPRIGVEITNADPSPGKIELELSLADLSTPIQPEQSLGRAPVTSSAEAGPTTEILNFTMPANPRIHQFDSARIRFIRYGRQSGNSAKIAVRRFILTPAGR